MNNPKCGIIIHNIVHARAALEASSATKVPIAIVSAPYAGCYAGVSWFLKIEEKNCRYLLDQTDIFSHTSILIYEK